MFLLHFLFGSKKEVQYSYVCTSHRGLKENRVDVLYVRMIGYGYYKALHAVEKKLKKSDMDISFIRILSVKRG